VLLALIEKGMERQAAYVVVQRNAIKVWDESRDFKSLLAQDPEVKLTAAELDRCFDLQRALGHVDAVFDRVLKKRE
jgi:adenylosuccinate lyase